jgi:3-hydroxyacyl-CoA dehydrogenase
MANAKRFRRVSVLGAGVMGSGIAAHLAGAGLDVLLLDIVPPDPALAARDRNAFARGGLDKALKSKPALFFTPRDGDRVRLGNFEDDLAEAARADLVIEVVKEDLAIKHALFARLEPLVAPHTIVASNTSGIAIHQMVDGRGAAFRARFLVTHFFNPVRYMRLLELVAGRDTDPEVLARVATFGEETLGKGIVHGKDTTNFVANRVGIHGMMWLIKAAVKEGYTVEEIDAIFGTPMGRARSAVFRTADMVGLDTVAHVAQNCYDNLPGDEEREMFKLPEVIERMVKANLLGDKTRAGFYKKTPAGVLALDLDTLEYREQQKPKFDALKAAKGAADLGARLRAVVYGQDRASSIALRATAMSLAYTSRRIPEIADDLVNIDRGMRWGYGWEVGPFETWDLLGVAELHKAMQTLGVQAAPWVPAMLAAGRSSFYGGSDAAPTYYDLGARGDRPVPTAVKAVSLQGLRKTGEVLRNDGASLIDLGDGIACLELHTKMNAIDGDVVAMVNQAVERVERDFDGLVVGNQAAEAFSAGANLFVVVVAAGQKNFAAIDQATKALQDSLMRLRYSDFPVVTAPFGLALGGGAEIAMHGDATRAHAELYMGQVEAGVGLVPAGGGCKELLCRALADLPEGVDPFPRVQQVFMTIAMGKVSMSAEEARALGFLRDSDGVTLNRDFLIHDAKQTALGLLRAGYRRPRPRTVRLPGLSGYATLRSALQQMAAAHQISEHDVLVGSKLAYILCGGDVSPAARVSEQHLLDLEREAFISLCGEPRSQERMQYMLMNNKPLRN